MKLPVLSVGCLALSLLAASCAPTSSADGDASRTAARTCFYPDQIVDFRAGDAQTLYVRTRRDEVIQMKSVGYCRDLETAHVLAISPASGADPRICTGDSAEVATSTAAVSSTSCRVWVERRLTEDQVAALPERLRP